MRTILGLALVLSACSVEGPASSGATARFDVGDAPIAFDAMPFPSDLRRDPYGHIRLGALPTSRGETRLFERVRELLEAREGFCATCGISFPIDGALERASVPSTTEGLASDPVILLELGEGTARQIPLRIDWRDDLGLVVLRPARGFVLHGTCIAALRSAIRAADGSPLAASSSFDRDAHTAAFATHGLDVSTIVAATTFTVEDPAAELRAAHALESSAPLPAITVDRVWRAGEELDALLGVPSEDRPGIDLAPRAGTEGTSAIAHDALSLVIAGRFTAPRFVTGAGADVGELRRDAYGELVLGPLEDVPFVLTIPAGVDLTRLPVLVHHHGFNASRVTGFAIADTVARAGVAVLSIDGYQHGARAASARDEANAIRGVDGADGFAETTLFDVSARAFGLSGVPRGEELFPGYPLGAFVQLAMDVVAAMRVVRESDVAPLRSADPSLSALAFDADRVLYLGNSMGSVVGTSVLAVERDVVGAVLNVPPGSIVETLVESPEFRGLVTGTLLTRLGVDLERFDEIEQHVALDPVVDLFRWALEPIDPLALAPELAGRDVLYQVAALDEVAAPPATRSFLLAAGATSPTIYEPAAHGMLEVTLQSSRYEPPHELPLVPRATPLEIVNPLVDIHAEIEAYLSARAR